MAAAVRRESAMRGTAFAKKSPAWGLERGYSSS
jgi:hypothetical protein